MAQKRKVEVIENPFGALYTAQQTAAILQVHRHTVISWIKEGKLKATKVGRGWRITKADLDDYVKNAPTRAHYGSSGTRKIKKQ